jgi:hypothetical protein
MHEQILSSTRDTLLFAIPFLGFLLMGLFRLDEVFYSPKRGRQARRPASGFDTNGEPILCDPDGRRVPTPYQHATRMVGSNTKSVA